MPHASPPVFGKRNRPPAARRATIAPPTIAPVPEAEAVFADAWARVETGEGTRRVPLSLRAALLAGLVIGFCLAGFDIGDRPAVDPALTALLPGDLTVGALQPGLPMMIVLNLLAGARVAAGTLLVAHRCLARIGQTSPLAYAAGGFGMAAAYGGLLLALAGHPPAHGWIIDLAAGAGGGFLYRMFAGAKPDRDRPPSSSPGARSGA